MPEMTLFATYLFFLAGFLLLTGLFLFLKRLLWKTVPVFKKLRLIGLFLTLSSLYICLKVMPVFKISNIDTWFSLVVWFILFYNLFTFIDVIFFDYYLIQKKKYEVPQLLRNLIKIVLVSLFIVLFLGKYIPKLSTGYFASLGVMSIILGLALQSLLADIFAGIIISINAPIRVRDWVRLDPHEGEIVEINWYNTKIRTMNNHLVVIPNGEILKTKLTNYSKPLKREKISLPIGVSYDTAPHEVDAAVREALRGIDNVSRKEEPEIYLEEYGDFSVNYTVYFYIDNQQHFRRIRHEFYRNLYYVLKRNNIVIPYPIQSLERHTPRKSPSAPKLDHHPHFSYLTPSEFKKLLSLGSLDPYGKGEAFLTDGEESRGLYFLVRGTAEVVKNGKVIASVEPGTILGEMSLLRDQPVSADCIMQTPGYLFFVPKKKLFTFMKECDALTETLSRLVVERDSANKEKGKNSQRDTLVVKEKKKILEKIIRFLET
ncbi:MAG TPA: mechanosensitive ion channel [Candidatus Mcinerneyibacteriales bacterium]|nr:mechanosensitive ion channel [Candidatus Mcinerneyibacteriales bacterium]HPJ70615.1 mechanosensitive ion channel [Candidatus Mcinerneyibacteriales bacterium]HPQ89513.1 mechanosensitive ion channel [Candidatus Mcinerneyibacteriales bacterium]